MRTRGIAGVPATAASRYRAATSNSSTLQLAAMAFAASCGIIPARACAWARAASNASIPRTWASGEKRADILGVLNKRSLGSGGKAVICLAPSEVEKRRLARALQDDIKAIDRHIPFLLSSRQQRCSSVSRNRLQHWITGIAGIVFK